jgi:hypothetical protein
MRHACLLAAAIALAACGKGDTTPDDAGPADAGPSGPLAPPAVGLQLVSSPQTLAAGSFEYECWSFPVPQGAPFPIIGLQQQVPAVGVHHYAVFTSSDAYYGAAPFDCLSMGASWGLVTGGGVGTPAVAFPTNTALTLNLNQNQNPDAGNYTPPVTQIVFQLHLLNATPTALTIPAAYINLESTTQPATDFQQIGLLIAGTLEITIPPNTNNVEISGGCGGSLTSTGGPSPNMPNIFAVFPHMHTLGTNIEVQITPQGSTTPNTLLNKSWNFGEQGLVGITPNASANAGDQVQVTCTYDNTTSNTVSFGLTTSDEMCFGVLYYWPADPNQTSQYCFQE